VKPHVNRKRAIDILPSRPRFQLKNLKRKIKVDQWKHFTHSFSPYQCFAIRHWNILYGCILKISFKNFILPRDFPGILIKQAKNIQSQKDFFSHSRLGWWARVWNSIMVCAYCGRNTIILDIISTLSTVLAWSSRGRIDVLRHVLKISNLNLRVKCFQSYDYCSNQTVHRKVKTWNGRWLKKNFLDLILILKVFWSFLICEKV
jgi:hypothetical protein